MARKGTAIKRSGMLVLGALLSLILLCTFSFASELDDVRAAIAHKKANWIARETSISHLPLDKGLTKGITEDLSGLLEANDTAQASSS